MAGAHMVLWEDRPEEGSVPKGIAEAPDVKWEKAGLLPGGGISDLKFALSDPNIVYLSVNVNAQGVWRSSDGGKTWEKRKHPEMTHLNSIAVHPTNPDIVFASELHGTIYRTLDGGKTWAQVVTQEEVDVTSTQALVISTSNPQIIYAANEKKGVVKSTDGGTAWEFVAPTMDHTRALAIDAVRENTLYAGRGERQVWKSSDGAKTWKKLDVELAITSLTSHPSQGGVMFAATPDGLFKTEDGGASWKNISQSFKESDVHQVAVSAKDPNVLYAGTKNGVYTSHDGGTSWSSASTGLAQLDLGAIAVHPQNPQVALAGTGIWKWMPSHAHEWTDVSAEGGVYRTENGGTTWIKSDEGFEDTDLDAIVLNPATPTTIYTGTTCSWGIFRSEDAGSSWSLLPGGSADAWDIAHYTMDIRVGKTAPYPLYLTGRFGIAKSLDRGKTWENLFERTHVHGLDVDPTNADIAYFGTTEDDDPTTVGKKGAHIYKTTDGGDNWIEMDAGFPHEKKLGIHTIAIDPKNPKVVYAGTSTHEAEEAVGIYKTSDAGEHWTPANKGLEDTNVIALLVHPAKPVLFAGTGTGLYRSTDDGASWTKTPLSGLEILSLALDTGEPDYLYVGTTRGIFKSGDLGISWIGVNAGLPERSRKVTGIAIDETNNILYAAILNGGVYQFGKVPTTVTASSQQATNTTPTPTIPTEESQALPPTFASPREFPLTTILIATGSALFIIVIGYLGWRASRSKKS